jgi:hypothetical protein
VPSSKPTLGVNDLHSQFPDIAAEAYGWDPETVTAKSGKKLDWKCSAGHIYSSRSVDRVNKNIGCPICSGQQVLKGWNDLQSKFPDIAAEAYEWDPSTVTAGTKQKKDWKCKEGHIYTSAVIGRTDRGNGCPFCSGHQVLAGFNDLKTKFPDIAEEVYMWDPTTVVAGTMQKKDWKCTKGHLYSSIVVSRTRNGNGCPVCSGYQVLAGFNDLKTKFPDIAAEAYGWDPSTVTAGSKQKKDWECDEDHIYTSAVNNRTNGGTGCPVCGGDQVLAGFNDLKTKFPDIAAEAYEWDPSTVTVGTKQKKDWKCKEGHIYTSSIKQRTGQGSGCPVCAEYGFDPEKDAWFYLMQRPGEQQLGISNVLVDRLKTHERNGWTLLEHTIEGVSGKKVQEIEALFKKWLKKEIGLMEGTTENWSTTKMEVQSLAELKARSGIETDLF